MHRLGCLARVAGVGGVISAASLLRPRQEQARDTEEEERRQQLPWSLSLRPGLHRPIVTPVSASWSDNVSEEQEVRETEMEMMAESVAKPNELSKQQAQAEKLKGAINKARNLVWCKMYESGAPGMVVAVSVNGKTVWQHGFGYSDLENHLLTGTGCVMRIASISKTITMAVLAKLWQEGKVDLDKDISEYVPEFPRKTVDGREVSITVRQLCCHMAGIRHYTRKGERDEDEFSLKEYFLKETFATTDDSLKLFQDDELLSVPGSEFHYTTHGFTLLAKIIENVTGEPFDKHMKKQFSVLGLNNTFLDEAEPIIYNRSRNYVRDKHHRLRNAPYVDNSYKWAGGGFLSTVGDLVKFGNAMLYSYQQKNVPSVNKEEQKTSEESNPKTKIPEPAQSALPGPCPEQSETQTEKKKSEAFAKKVSFEESLDMVNYVKEIVYQPGPLSSVNSDAKTEKKVRYLPGYLSSDTMTQLWTPQPGADLSWGGHDLTYGLGWAVRKRKKNYGYCLDQSHYVSHTGGAIGASSVLLVAPAPASTQPLDSAKLPQGVVVSVLCNLQEVGLNKLAADVAGVFQGLDLDKPARVHKVYQC